VARSPRPPEGGASGGLTLPPFYPILDVDIAQARGLNLERVLDAWLEAGVRLVQLRAKPMHGAALLALAETCRARTREAGAIFIVNDRIDVARLVEADGAHVGQDDLPPAAARRLLGDGPILGWSTHNEAQLQAARAEPIDYVAIGPVFQTGSKERPDPVVGLDGVRRAKELAAGRPVVAIGGITLDRAVDVLRAGASTVAVIGDVMVSDAAARAREFVAVTSTC
jgi:thiamine-phosphate pyrophosphorylase